MPRMCPENRKMLAWVEAHYQEVAAWLLVREGKNLDDLDAWGKCDAGYAMLTQQRTGRP